MPRDSTRRWSWRTATRCSATRPTTPPPDGRSGRSERLRDPTVAFVAAKCEQAPQQTTQKRLTEGRPMAWDFSTDPEWAEQLAWVETFVRAECEPIDLIVKE